MQIFSCINEALNYAQVVANRVHPSGNRRSVFLVQYRDGVSVQTNKPISERRVMLTVKPTPYPKSEPSRVKGVNYQRQYNNFRAYLVINGKQIHLGLFRDWFEAICAKLSAENRLRTIL